MSEQARDLIIVMGDLCLDARATGADPGPFERLGQADSATLRASTTLAVGGTGWLLVRAALMAGYFRPVLMAAIGTDPWADGLLRSVREAGLHDAWIQRIESAPTDLVCLIMLDGRQRVMFRPEQPTGNRLDR